MKRIVSRILALIPALALEVLWIILLVKLFEPIATYLGVLLQIIAVIVSIYLLNKRSESSYKELWIMVILGFPILGTTLYILFGNKRPGKPLRRKLKKANQKLDKYWPDDHDELFDNIQKEDTRIAQSFHLVEGESTYPLRKCEDITYYPLGELAFEQMLKDMEEAKEFIYAEYFIIEGGKMWDSMVEVMARKVAEGVDVRVVYDDLGSFATYSARDVKGLREKGIQCVPFNPARIVIGTLNYRSHRKMLIIDGKVAFSGGINLADEYINEIHPYGHWKDIAFRITGAPVINYIWMFAEFWNAFAHTPLDLPRIDDAQKDVKDNGYILSYYDSPINDPDISNSLFVDLLAQAKHYAYFYTPYLMPGDTLLDAFINAAKRGVDVKIITPGISDSKFVQRMAKSYYPTLLKAGVRIFEYTPGFVHAKATLVDDEIGSIGTVNMDYRSLYLHYENNSFFYKSSVLGDLKKDYLETLDKCEEVKLDDLNLGLGKRIVNALLRLITPLC